MDEIQNLDAPFKPINNSSIKENLLNIEKSSEKILQERLVSDSDNQPIHFQSMGHFSICSVENTYDPFKVPPNIQLAKKHGLARRVCINKPDRDLSLEVELCPCCGLPVQNSQYPICVDTNDFIDMGSCYPAYFDFIKFCSVLILGLFFTSGIFLLLARDVFGGACEKFLENDSIVCTWSFIDLLQSHPANKKIIRMLCILILINVFMIIIAIEAFKISSYLKGKELDCKNIGVNDFTVKIAHLPLDADPNHLKEFISSQFSYEVHIEKTYFIFDFSEYEKLYEAKKKKIKERERKRLNPEVSVESILEEDIDADLNSFENALLNKDHSKMKFTGTALITFSRIKDAKILISKWKFTNLQKIQTFFMKFLKFNFSSLSKYLYRGKIIKIKRAPLPSDLTWTHHLDNDQKWKPRLATNFGTIVILLIGMGIVLALKRAVKNEQEDTELNQVFSLGLSFAESTVIALINTTLGIFIRRFADYESHLTKTGFFISVTYKLTRAFFLNMVVATFLSNFVAVTLRKFIKPYEVNMEGLVNDIFFLFITNSYMSSIFNFFDIVWGWRLFRRYQIEKHGDKCTIPQCEVNYIFEGHPVDMALRYSNILKTVFFTAIYGPVIPIGYVFSFLGLIINYWVDKYLLIRRYVCENKLSYQLPKFIMKFMKMVVIMLGFINLVISLLPLYYIEKTDAQKKKNFELTSSFFIALLSLMVAVGYQFFPNWVFYKGYECFFQIKPFKKTFEDSEYLEIKKQFTEDYSSVHPILKVGEIEKKLKIKKTRKERRNTPTEKRRMTLFDMIKKENDKKAQINLQS